MAIVYPSVRDDTELITGEELLEMVGLGPCELIDGRIIPMSPTGNEHGIIESELMRRLGNFNADKRIGWLTGGEAGIYTRRNPDRVRGMDIAFISRQRQPKRPKRFLEVPPELIVEIVSPGDSWQDLRTKLDEYFAIGVDRVWVVEPRRSSVLVYRTATDTTELGADETLRGEGLLEGFSMAVSELFED